MPLIQLPNSIYTIKGRRSISGQLADSRVPRNGQLHDPIVD